MYNSEQNNTTEINSITCTIIFDGSALNRDEKIGNNILSIKKLTYHGEIRPFISKNAIRHYLFNSLNKAFKKNWEPTPVILRGEKKQTLQFDLTKADILSYNELAAFGYMFTKSGETSITRKAPVGITKAIGLSIYNQDMAFYANQDLVQRSINTGYKADPSPINKEEYSGFFKLSFTIDADMLGKDTWIVDNYDYDSNNNILTIKIAEPQSFIIYNCKEITDDNGNKYYEVNNNKKLKIDVNDNTIKLPKEMIKIDKNGNLEIKPEFANDRKENKNKKNSTTYKFKVLKDEYTEDNNQYFFECSFDPIYQFDNNTLTLELGYQKEIQNAVCKNTFNKNIEKNEFEINNIGKIIITSLNKNNIKSGPFKIEFLLNKNKIKNIICNILTVIKNGLSAQSSNEINTIKPLFMIASEVSIPCPIFHADIDIKKTNNNFEIIGIEDAINNDWIKNKIYLQFDQIFSLNKIPQNNKITNDWQSFLKSLNLDCKTETQQESETNASNESTINTDIPTNGSF